MPNVFDLSGEFYDKHPNLFEGMTVSADELYFLLAGDITQAYHKTFGKRIGITTDLAGEALKGALSVRSVAFQRGETAKVREGLLLSWLDEQVAELQSNPQAHGLNCSAEHLRTAYSNVRDTNRKVREAAFKMSGTIPGLCQDLLALIKNKAEVIAADRAAGTIREKNGLSGNIAELITAAAVQEHETLESASSGLAKAALFATAGADLTERRLASDDPAEAPRNLFRWEDPGALKRHYPETADLDAAGLDRLSCEIASRINYPFGLRESSSRNDMLAAIFLTHSFLPNATAAALATQVSAAAGLVPGQEITPDIAAGVALRATAAAYTAKKIQDFHGFDFVRIAGTAAARALPAPTSTGWPPGLLEALLRGPQDAPGAVQDAADALSAAIPLTEPGVAAKKSWARASRWETAGEIAARIIHNDAAYRSSGPGVRDEETDSPTMSSFGTESLVTSQFDRLLQDFPMEQLLFFRNDLVNSETGNREEPCTFDGLLSLNGFLKKWTASQLNERLKDLREARQNLVLELRRAARACDPESRHSEGYLEDLMPERVIRELVAQNLVYAELLQDAADPARTDAVLEAIHGTAGQSGIDFFPVPAGANSEGEIQEAIKRNNHLIGIEPEPEPEPDLDAVDPEPAPKPRTPWLGLLTSPSVSRQLSIFANADEDYTYTASLGSVQSSIEFSGPVLRDAACALQAFIVWATKRRSLAKTVPDAIQTYLKNQPDLPVAVRHLRAGATTLAASLVLDAHKASAGAQHLPHDSMTGL